MGEVNTERGLDQVPRVSLWNRSELIRRQVQIVRHSVDCSLVPLSQYSSCKHGEMRPTCPRCGGPHVKSACSGAQRQREADRAAEAQVVAPVDDLPQFGDLVLLWDLDYVDGPRWVAAEFFGYSQAEGMPAERSHGAGTASCIVQRLDTGGHVWRTATHVRKWIPKAFWREMRDRYHVEFRVHAPAAGAPATGPIGEGALDARATGWHDRSWHHQWIKDVLARRWAGKRWWKVDQATRDRLRKKHTVASPENRPGRWAAAEASKISDAECAGPATKQEPQEFIGCIGDFGLDRQPGTDE